MLKSRIAEDEIDLGQLVRTLWRGKFWIVALGVITLFIGTFYAFSITTPKYQASAVVAFENREGGQVVDFESVVGGLAGDQATINTEVEVLRSRGLVEKLVDQLNLMEDPEFNSQLQPQPRFSIRQVLNSILGREREPQTPTDEAIRVAVVDAALARISIKNISNSYVFRITAKTKNPRKSAKIANALAEIYILDQLEVKFEATEQATAWLTDRVSDLQVSLEQAVEAVKVFSASSELISPETLTALNRQIKDLRDRQRTAQAAITTTAARTTALRAAQEQDGLAAMTEVADDRTLTRMLELIEKGSVADRTGFDTRFGQILARAELEETRAVTQAEAFETSIAELESQIATQSEDLVTLQQLEREAEASRLIYEYFLSRLKETSVQQGIQQADSRVLSRAVVPRIPSEPRKSLIMALSLMLGLFAGSAMILIREFMQNTFRNAEELEAATGHTVMGQIPLMPARKRANVLKYLMDKPTSAAAESIRNLRTSVLLSNVDSPPQIIMSTSSIPGEGKTTQSIALAQNLSGLGKKVLLVEGDIRRRVFAEYFDIKGQKGLLAVLSGEVTPEEVVIHNEQLGADILIGEKSYTNAADIFSSEAFKQFLAQARKLYDYIIIDTPPVLVVPDARVVGQSVDAILYSVKWDSTTRRQVSEGIKSFESVNLRISGLVLSQINARGMARYGYGDGYGAYGKYGSKYYDS